MTREEIIKQYEMAVEGGELIAPFMGEDVKEVYEMLKAGLSALRPITREQVEKVWRGEWELVRRMAAAQEFRCSVCGANNTYYGHPEKFCADCGSAMTDEAVQMVMERISEMEEMTNEH